MNKPVVLFLIDTLNTGGAERSLLDIVSRFKRYRPVVCHIYPGETLKAKFLQHGVETHSLNIQPRYHWDEAARAVEKLLTKVKPVLIHSTLFKSDIVSRRIGSKHRIPLVNSLVNNSYHPSRYRSAGIIMRLKLKGIQWYDAWTARKVDLFISNSESIRQSNSRAINIPLEKIKVIYRGRSADNFEIDDSVIAAVRKESGIPDEATVLLNVSRLIHRKGQLELIRAFKSIIALRPNTFLLIAGEGPFRATLDNEIKVLDLTGRVRMLGDRNDVPSLMKAADIFVFPSHYEGLPGVLIEAMLAKLPIAASAIPENLECINDRTAYLFEANDQQGMVLAIQNILENDAESLLKASQAYLDACEKFEIHAIAERYEVAYDELAFAPK